MEPCPNCGQPVRSTARFCTSCGYRIPERPQGSTNENTSFAATWVDESTGTAAQPVAADSNPAATWPETPEIVAVAETVEVVEAVPDTIYAPPAVAVDPIDEIVAATAGFNADEDSLVNRSENRINIALYHIETLRQLIPELSEWSEERAQSVNNAIAAMEAAIKGREEDTNPYVGLRQTVAAARQDPRDIDVMIALSDRAIDIEDLLKAHDAYSIGIREALIDLKPLAVEYVLVPPKRRPPARKPAAPRSTAAKPKTSSTASKTTSASKTTAAKSSTTSTAKSTSSRSTTASKTTK